MLWEKKAVRAGSEEKGDMVIELEPAPLGSGITIALQCDVEIEFGRQIRRTITETLQEYGLADAQVTARDKGAMDFVVRARAETAAKRAGGEKQ